MDEQTLVEAVIEQGGFELREQVKIRTDELEAVRDLNHLNRELMCDIEQPEQGER